MTVKLRVLAATFALAASFGLAGCGSDDQSSSAEATGACPVAPVNVVVSVAQWGDIVTELGGDCAKVTTVIASSSLDPHDYEPSPADAAKYVDAQLVVINGGHYDEWAAQLAASSAPNAPVVSAVDLKGAEHDENPHVWYNPAVVTGVADAVTAQLSELAPEAKSYFDQRRAQFADDLTPYDDLIAKIRAGAQGKTYGATESVFDYMAAAVGLTDRTPEGYQVAASNESDPSPADLDAFTRLLSDKGVDVLIYNIQTEGSVPQQLRTAAEAGGVPVVEVTESPAPGSETFQSWQVAQLEALAKALGVAA